MDQVDRFDESKATVQLPAPPLVTPRALPKEHWEALPEDSRPEALSRASWLVFMGTGLRDALIDAVEGMQQDLRSVLVEPTWGTLAMLAEEWPRFPRRSDGRYLEEIVEVGSRIEEAARETAIQQGGRGQLDIEVPIGVQAGILDRAFAARVAEILGMLQAQQDNPLAES